MSADVEAIHLLKARYFRLMDTKHWDEWADVFTEDAELWAEDHPDIDHKGRDQLVAAISQQLGEAVTVHHGHMPEIVLEGPDSARGIWAMSDYVERSVPGGTMVIEGTGHYHETYRREADGAWRIATVRLERLRVVRRFVVTGPSASGGSGG